MKKLISGLSALAIMAMPLTAFADTTIDQDTPEPKQGEAVITTEIAPAYIVTIPTDTKIPFNSLETELGKIELTKATLDPGAFVMVGFAGTEESPVLKNKADESKTIPYRFKYDSEGFAISDCIGTEFGMQTEGESGTFSVTIKQEDWDKAYAGEYSDTVTFTIRYEDAPAAEPEAEPEA